MELLHSNCTLLFGAVCFGWVGEQQLLATAVFGSVCGVTDVQK